MNEAVIVSGARTAVGRAPRGTLRAIHPVDMTAAAIGEAIGRAGGLDRGRRHRVRDAGGDTGIQRGATLVAAGRIA
jgi:acetyl-CoA acetyltransferase